MNKLNSIFGHWITGTCRVLIGLLAASVVPVLASAGTDAVSGTLLFAPSVEVSGFKAVVIEGQDEVTVGWSTEMEEGVHAFRLERRNEDGSSEEIGLVRARGFEEGFSYQMEDGSVGLGDAVHYDLFLVSRHGDQQIAAFDGTVESVPVPEPMMMAAVETAAVEDTPISEGKYWIGNGDRVRIWTNAAPADRIRFSLTEEGVYKVTAQEIADAGGWDYDSVTNALATTNLSMSCQGADAAWHPLDDGLIFYGVEPSSRWAPENVYWIEFGPGLNMQVSNAAPPEAGTTNAWFMDHLFVQGTGSSSRVWGNSSLADEPDSFLSFSPFIFLSGDSAQYEFQLTDRADGEWLGEVTANFLSYYEVGTDVHTGQVSVGSSVVGTPVWEGEIYYPVTYTFSSSNLVDSTILLGIANISVPPPIGVDDYTRFRFISCAFSYPRKYIVRNGQLLCSGGSGNVIAFSGSSDTNAILLDVTEVDLPRYLTTTAYQYDNVASNYTGSFVCGGASAQYAVCLRGDGVRRPSVRGVANVNWSSSENAADYVILIPPEAWVGGFRATMQELADYRIAQGLRTEVVDVESIYNQYSHGLVAPEAIKTFCQTGVSNWTAQPLRYLLLAGDGTTDFKHDRFVIGDFTACLIPTIVGGQRFSSGEAAIVALDSLYGDVDGDGAPEVAIGRIPTVSSNDLRTVLDKIYAYESALLRPDGSLGKQYIALAPDWDNLPGTVPYYQFDEGLDRVIPFLSSSGCIHVPCRADPADPNNLYSVKINTLIPSLHDGLGIFHFFGHTGYRSLGYGGSGSRLLWDYDIVTNNWTKPSIAVFVGCQNNAWLWTYNGTKLLTTGMLKENTGFVGGLGSTGYLLADEGEERGVYLHEQFANPDIYRLGDVYKNAITVAIEDPSNPYKSRVDYVERQHSLSLVGDPALVFRHDVTAMGTDVEWLVAHGQTAANADLEDPDSDGWATWQEFQDNTNPTNNRLQFAGMQVDPLTGEPSLAFETSANHTYQVLYTPELSESNEWQLIDWSWPEGAEWNPAASSIVPSGPVTTIAVPAVTNQGFYRMQEN